MELWCCLSLVVRCWRVSPRRPEMLFGKKKRLPPFLPAFSTEMHTDHNFHPKMQECWEKLELGLNIAGWAPPASPKHARSSLPVDFVPLQHLSCIVGGTSRFWILYWMQQPLFFFLDGHFVCGEYSMVLSCLGRNEHWMKWNFQLCDS